MPLYEVTSYNPDDQLWHSRIVDADSECQASMVELVRLDDVIDARAVELDGWIENLMKHSPRWKPVPEFIAAIEEWQQKVDKMIAEYRNTDRPIHDFDEVMADEREGLHDLVMGFLNEREATAVGSWSDVNSRPESSAS